ncbi:hypothetical protein E2C01_006335 [Portunus trituberculatus]|uniref:Uncharacterized protein n=1 Tax=Portunus trituberculatus TaxID=210409 RepID=A0A5B7CWL7_PORTR|nr:hypothetical protein [Portunus trituberculatus]
MEENNQPVLCFRDSPSYLGPHALHVLIVYWTDLHRYSNICSDRRLRPQSSLSSLIDLPATQDLTAAWGMMGNSLAAQHFTFILIP